MHNRKSHWIISFSLSPDPNCRINCKRTSKLFFFRHTSQSSYAVPRKRNKLCTLPFGPALFSPTLESSMVDTSTRKEQQCPEGMLHSHNTPPKHPLAAQLIPVQEVSGLVALYLDEWLSKLLSLIKTSITLAFSDLKDNLFFCVRPEIFNCEKKSSVPQMSHQHTREPFTPKGEFLGKAVSSAGT